MGWLKSMRVFLLTLFTVLRYDKLDRNGARRGNKKISMNMENQVIPDILVNPSAFTDYSSRVSRQNTSADLHRAGRFVAKRYDIRYVDEENARGSVYFVNEPFFWGFRISRSEPIRTIRLNSSNTRRGASLFFFPFFIPASPKQIFVKVNERFFQGASSSRGAARALTVPFACEANTFRVTTLIP